MTNLTHDYYINLLKILLKKSSYSDKFKVAESIEREAMRIATTNQAVQSAKISLVTRIIMVEQK